MRRRTPKPRTIQVVIIVLLLLSAAQVLWWILDQARRTRALEERLTSLYTDDQKAAEKLIRFGSEQGAIEDLFPHLTVEGDGTVRVRPEVLERLSRDRARWLNQYGWEGTFFLFVLAASIGVVWRALRQENLLRRRQENFMAAVSHELKSPLASLQLSVETLGLRDLPRTGVEELTARMEADLARMRDMVSKILEASRLQERRVDLRREPVDLEAAVRATVRELGARARAGEVDVSVDIEPGLAIHADRSAVTTVLRNLLDNAIHAVELQGGGSVAIQAERGSPHIRLSVSDDGVGFAEDETKRLFEKFYRPGDEMRRGGQGQGLGLYITRRFVELHGGTIRASSPGPGQGARFDVWWPTEASA